jgi:DNA-binding response OmpR family regulator
MAKGRDMRVLVVEDERALADAVVRGLRQRGMAVDVAYDGTLGEEMATTTRYDVVVLDRDLPGVHGDDICAELVASEMLTGVLMLTASGTVEDKVRGFGIGADDYLAKPFAFEELVARVQALGRRISIETRQPTGTRRGAPVLQVWAPGDVLDMEFDANRRIVTRSGRGIDLTRKEFGVLELLLRAGGAVVSSEMMLERVWDANADPFTTTVRVTMMTLRRKLGEPALIETLVGAGYRINPGYRIAAAR